MISTDRFVYIHLPKTGGTFVTSVLERLKDLLGARVPWHYSPRTAFIPSPLKHGGARDIPRRDRAKPVLTTIRNPYDMYVSEYEFGWWKRKEYPRYFRRRVRGFRELYPDYPDLTFERFLRLWNHAFCRGRHKDFDAPGTVGWLTHNFIEFYLPKPRPVLRDLDDATLSAEGLRARMGDVRFLHTENLNEELHGFLLGCGYPEQALAFILELGKIVPEGSGRTDDQRWQDYYPPELKARVRARDRVLFELFPEYDT